MKDFRVSFPSSFFFLLRKAFFFSDLSFFCPPFFSPLSLSLSVLPQPNRSSQKKKSYADVIVHRLLAAAIGVDPPPPGASPETLATPKPELAHELVAENLNARHRGAQLAARASVELHTLLFFRARQKREGDGAGNGGGGGKERGTIADARVVGVWANGVVVFVPRFGIEGPAFFSDGDDEKEGGETASKEWTLSADGCGATDPVSGKTVRVFDVATVRISVRGGGGGNGTLSGGGGRERLALELVDRSLLAAEDVAT